MVSIELICKVFGDITRELMREKIDMISHARHHVYSKTKKGRKMIGRGKERERIG